MNPKQYRAAFDQIPFSPDFQKKTVQSLLNAVGPEPEKEFFNMKHRFPKTALIAAALCAVLAVTAAAAAGLLNARDVAAHFNDPTLAAAFDSPDALTVNQSIESGDYRFTLAGLVSGSGISDWSSSVESDRTYAVLSISRIDGQPIPDSSSDDFVTFHATPLVSGYTPWTLNAWTLNGSSTYTVLDGVLYYLYDYESVEMFADHTVYLAAYDGTNYMAPGSEMFAMADDGSISFLDTFTDAHALFTLPLDPSKADPAAAEDFVAHMFGSGSNESAPAASEDDSPYHIPDDLSLSPELVEGTIDRAKEAGEEKVSFSIMPDGSVIQN